jgi:chemotaxis protein MotB
MRKLMFVVGLAALVGCGGISKEQYGAKEAEAAKYKQAASDESGKVAALESKVQSLEQQNTALQGQMDEMHNKLAASGATQQEMREKATIRLNERLPFAENSSKLSPEAKRTLDAMADAVAQAKGKHIIVAGYTDDTEGGKGGATKRWQLSTARALEVAKYLAGRGIDPKLVAVAGFGEARPVAPNDSRANRGLNRRAEIALTSENLQLETVDLKPAELKSK